MLDVKGYDPSNPYSLSQNNETLYAAAEEEQEYKTIPQLEKGITKIKKEMELSAMIGERVDLSSVMAKFNAGDREGAFAELKSMNLYEKRMA